MNSRSIVRKALHYLFILASLLVITGVYGPVAATRAHDDSRQVQAEDLHSSELHSYMTDCMAACRVNTNEQTRESVTQRRERREEQHAHNHDQHHSEAPHQMRHETERHHYHEQGSNGHHRNTPQHTTAFLN